MSTKPKMTTICVAGSDGSGKTTQVARLASALEAQGRTVASATVWDALIDPGVASKLPVGRPADIYGYLKLLSPLARTHFLFHALHLAMDRALHREPDVLLLNAYWYKYVATEVAHGGDLSQLRPLAVGFPKPDQTFYLDMSPEDTLSRKARRSDYESGYGPDEAAFLAFQRRAQAVLRSLADEMGWVQIKGSAPACEITEQIIGSLEVTR